MKKLILLTSPFIIIVSLYAAKDKKHINSKQLNVPNIDMPRVYLSPPQCPSNAVLGEIVVTSSSSDIPPYTHCTECGLGAMFGDKGQERCSYCGFSDKKYHSIAKGD